MPAPLMTIASSPDLPREADAVVIGGGIVGTCAAYFLARRGLSVALVEKGRIGAEQSSRNWGWCRQQNRDARELPMATESLSLWEDIAADLGEDLGFRRCGLLYLSDDDAELEGWARWRDFARTQGVTTHMLTAAEAARTRRGHRQALEGRRLFADRRHRRPVAGGAADCARRSETWRQRPSVLRRSRDRDRGRSGVGRGHGAGNDPYAQVVMAGGAWASSFCRQLGISFPQSAARSSVLSLMPRRRRSSSCPPYRGGFGHAQGRRRPDARGLGHGEPRSDAADLPLRSGFPSHVRAALASPVARGAAGLARRPREPEEMGARPADADGADPHPRPAALAAHPRHYARAGPSAAAGLVLLARPGHVGRLHRQHARRRSGHRSVRRAARLPSRRRLLGPRLRHRTGGRAPRRRSSERRQPSVEHRQYALARLRGSVRGKVSEF